MTIPCDPVETRAIATAGMLLAYSLVGMLKKTGVLDAEAVEDTFEAALSSLENALAPDDRAAALARQLLDLMGAQLAAHVAPPGGPPEPERRRSGRRLAANSELAHR